MTKSRGSKEGDIIEVQQSPGTLRTTFRYNTRTDVAVVAAWLFTQLAFSVASIYLLMHAQENIALDDVTQTVVLDGAFVSITVGLFIYFTRWWIGQHRPIAVDNVGIESIFFGKTFRTIPWHKVELIVKAQRSVPNMGVQRSFVQVVGSDTRIRFDNNLTGYVDLLRIIEKHIIEFPIQIRFEDWSGMKKKTVFTAISRDGAHLS